ncbi:1-phosphofructokinase family hexose kinase [Arthrobacter sp. B0490]|uniref:1-phosphofructokinase family hexose kinase n=1 Tax=Arthrobacter sp. B0490 TaxID=2058891 RepID=UPI000CE57832|nr:hexose kinase [Arthrobacter sp. B0490]
MTPSTSIVTVTPNPALDTTYTVPALVPGRSHRVAPPVVKAGGKGLNVARVIHQTGHGVHAILPVGGDSGALLKADLVESGISHSLVDVALPTRRSIAIHDRAAGDATLLNEEGYGLTPDEWDLLAGRVLQWLPRSGCLAGSGSLPPDAAPDFYARLVDAARPLGLPTIIDTSGPALLAAARAGATVLKPNHHELLKSTGEVDPERGAMKLLALGAGLVLVSQGEKGMLAFEARGSGISSWHAGFPTVLAGNPTGAGDAAVAAVAVLLAQGVRHAPDLLRAATGWSAAAVPMPTAGVLHGEYRAMTEAVVVRPGAAGTRSAASGAAPHSTPAKDSPWD